MKTCEALRSAGFHSITTIEFRVRNINYVEVQLDVPDFGSNPAAAAPAVAAKPSEAPSSAASAPTPDGSNDVAAAAAPGVTEDTGDAGKGDHGGGDGALVVADAKQVGGSVVEEKDGSKAGEKEGLDGDGGGVAGDVDNTAHNAAATRESATPKENGIANAQAGVSGSSKRPREEASASGEVPAERGDGGVGVGDGDGDGGISNAGRGRNERLHPKAAIRAAEAVAGKGGARKPPMKLVCAQPFPLMRGHTAFLTFATTPVARLLESAAAAAEDGATTAVSAEKSKGGSVGEQNASLGGGLEKESNLTRGGGEMDVCEEKGVAGEGKGKVRDPEKPAECAEGRAASVSDSVDSSSVAER